MAFSTSAGKEDDIASFVPDSMTSYLMGCLRTDFAQLKNRIKTSCGAVDMKENDSVLLVKHLLEELLRYLYILAEFSSTDESKRFAPSPLVNNAHSCLVLDPVLYFRVCDEILTMQGKPPAAVSVRVLPYEAVSECGADDATWNVRYTETLSHYQRIFGDPTPGIWPRCGACDDNLDEATHLLVRQNGVRTFEEGVAPDGGTSLVQPPPGDTIPPSPPPPLPLLAPPPPPPPSPPPVLHKYLRVIDLCDKHMDVPITAGTRFSDVISPIRDTPKVPGQRTYLVYEGLLLREHVLPYSVKMQGGEVVVCAYATVSHTVRTKHPVHKTTTQHTVFTTYAARIEKVKDAFWCELQGWKLDMYITLYEWRHKEGATVPTL